MLDKGTQWDHHLFMLGFSYQAISFDSLIFVLLILGKAHLTIQHQNQTNLDEDTPDFHLYFLDLYFLDFGSPYPWFPFVLAPLSLCSQPHRDYLSNKVDNCDNILINKQTIRWEKSWQFWQYFDPETKQWDKKGYLTIALCSKTIIRLTISFLVVTSAMKPPCEHFLSVQYEHQLPLVQPDMQKTENLNFVIG